MGTVDVDSNLILDFHSIFLHPSVVVSNQPYLLEEIYNNQPDVKTSAGEITASPECFMLDRKKSIVSILEKCLDQKSEKI